MPKNAPTGVLHKRVGEKITLLRQALEISQEELADLVGVDRSYIGFIERGERNITLKRLTEIADELGVEPWELLK